MKQNNIIELSQEEYKDILQQFYEYLAQIDRGYVFEDFLKTYLEKIGL